MWVSPRSCFVLLGRACTIGTASVWERRLDTTLSHTTDDGVVRTKAEMVALHGSTPG